LKNASTPNTRKEKKIEGNEREGKKEGFQGEKVNTFIGQLLVAERAEGKIQEKEGGEEGMCVDFFQSGPTAEVDIKESGEKAMSTRF